MHCFDIQSFKLNKMRHLKLPPRPVSKHGHANKSLNPQFKPANLVFVLRV